MKNIGTFLLVSFCLIGFKNGIEHQLFQANYHVNCKNNVLDTIIKISQLVANKDVNELNLYIDPSVGLIVYYRDGIHDRFTKYFTFPSQFVYSEYYPFEKHEGTEHKFFFEDLPSYNCGTNSWSKMGAFASINAGFITFDESAVANEMKYNPNSSIKAEIEFIESNGTIAINTTIGSDGLVFWVVKKNNSYYLALIDLVMTDCST